MKKPAEKTGGKTGACVQAVFRKQTERASDAVGKTAARADASFSPFEKMKYLTSEISGRIWEKSLESRDFLMLRLGTGTVPSSYEISMSGGDLANRDVDDLMEQSQHMQRVYKDIRHAPVTVDLQEGPMGLVGKPQIVKNEIHQLIGQLAFFNSYHDLRFVFIFHEDEYKEWEWMKWLPQFQLPHMYAKGFIYNEQTRDQLLSSIYELLRERDLEEDKEKRSFSRILSLSSQISS